MLFVIYCIDKPGVSEKRAQVMQAHKDYTATNPIKIVMSGPLTSDDGEEMIGSFFLVEAESREEVEAFRQADPLVQADLFEVGRSARLLEARGQ